MRMDDGAYGKGAFLARGLREGAFSHCERLEKDILKGKVGKATYLRTVWCCYVPQPIAVVRDSELRSGSVPDGPTFLYWARIGLQQYTAVVHRAFHRRNFASSLRNIFKYHNITDSPISCDSQ